MSSSFFGASTICFPKLRSPLTFDIYVRLSSEKYTRIFSKGDRLDFERMSSYVLKGAEYFYIPKEQNASFLNSTSEYLENLVKAGELYNKEAQKILAEVSARALTEIYETHVLDESTHHGLVSVVNSYRDIARRQPAVFTQMLELAKIRPTIIRHQITTSVFATLLAKAYAPQDLDLLFMTGYAALVHDIGLALLGIEADEHSLRIEEKLQKKIRMHPRSGAQLINSVKGVPPEVTAAVLQHHEGYDGSGYPLGLKGEAISIGARIVHITDAFAGLVIGTGHNIAIPPALAMHSLALDKSHDPKLFKLLANLLNLG